MSLLCFSSGHTDWKMTAESRRDKILVTFSFIQRFCWFSYPSSCHLLLFLTQTAWNSSSRGHITSQVITDTRKLISIRKNNTKKPAAAVILVQPFWLIFQYNFGLEVVNGGQILTMKCIISYGTVIQCTAWHRKAFLDQKVIACVIPLYFSKINPLFLISQFWVEQCR